MKLSEYKEKKIQDPEFKKEYDKIREELSNNRESIILCTKYNDDNEPIGPSYSIGEVYRFIAQGLVDKKNVYIINLATGYRFDFNGAFSHTSFEVMDSIFKELENTPDGPGWEIVTDDNLKIHIDWAWVPTTEELPKEGRFVLLCFKEGKTCPHFRYQVGYLGKHDVEDNNFVKLWEKQVWYTNNYYYDIDEVFAWMPIPEIY